MSNSAYKTIHLVKTDQNNLELTIEGSKFLKSIQHNFAFCVCVGPYRQGKSYLLSRLVDKKTAFNVGHTEQACTKGAWIYAEPISIKNHNKKDLKLYFIDTEGLESENNKWDTKIFLLSYLISSVFLYNTKTAITSDAIKKLSAILVLKKIISTNKANDSSGFKPEFIWIVRDYALNSTVDANKRLKEFLKLENEMSEPDSDDEDYDTKMQQKNEIKNKNQTKKRMSESFNQLECIYMPLPVSDNIDGKSYEESLQSLNDIDENKLRPEFNKSLDKLKNMIIDKAKNKLIENKPLNGLLFENYLREILKLINLESNIKLNDILSSGIKSIAESLFEKAKQNYTTQMDTLVYPGKEPIRWDSFNSKESQIKNESLQIIKNGIGDLSNDLIVEYERKFNEFREVKRNNDLTGGKLFEYNQMNRKNIDSFNEKKATDLWEKDIKPKHNFNILFVSKADFDEEIDRFKNKLKNELVEVEDFNSFWNQFCSKIDYQQVKERVYNHFNSAPIENKNNKNNNDRASPQKELILILNKVNPREYTSNTHEEDSDDEDYEDSEYSENSDDDDDDEVNKYPGKKVGSYKGNTVYIGPRGGFYYIKNGKRIYIKKEQVEFC